MAVISFTWYRANQGGIVNDVKSGLWLLGQDDVGQRVKTAEYSDRTIQHIGGYSGGASLVWRGSNLLDPDESTPADWFTLHAAHDGLELTALTANGGGVLLDNPLWISPLVSGGDVSTEVKALISLKKGT